MPSKRKSPASGGGRKSNSEPRLQVFKEFQGCNFELSPREFTLGKDVYQEQSDLAMNFVVVQNNAAITSNKTIETRNNMISISGPSDVEFSGPCIMIRDRLFAAFSDGSIRWRTWIGSLDWHVVELDDQSLEPNGHTWQSFTYINDLLIATTEENKLWTGEALADNVMLSNAARIPDPPKLTFDTSIYFTVVGDLQVSNSYDPADYPHAVTVTYSWVNKYGPTAHAEPLTFYANYPVEEWHAGRYLRISSGGGMQQAYLAPSGVIAVEFYYSVSSSSSYLPAGRTDDIDASGMWAFDWYGYLDATNQWAAMDLIASEQNYTEGPPASHVTCIDSRLYFWGNEDKPERLYIGGNSGNLFNLSPGAGGGFVDVEPGTGQEIRVVTKYKTQSGASIVTLLCTSPNSSKEQRYNLVENSISLSNEQSMKSYQAEQVAGAVGCKSFNGAIVCEDGLYSISRYGVALTTMTMEYNAQIRTNYVSNPIKPAFTEVLYNKLAGSIIFEIDGILYIALSIDGTTLDDLLFCYDIDNKAWWTYELGIDEPILNLFNYDYEGDIEGIGIITENQLFVLPTTFNDNPDYITTFDTVIQTGELSTQMPQQAWSYVSQLEFRFDYFLGSVTIELTGIDQFGRKVTTKKEITHGSTVYNDAEYMRVDLRLQSYQIRITGRARFRLTHFIAKVYPMSAKQGLVWGFDDSQSFREFGDIHPTFKDYNDIRKAIIP